MKNDSRTEVKREIAVLVSHLRKKKEQQEVFEEIERQKGRIVEEAYGRGSAKVIDLS